jgi:hypothetical protein
LAGCDSGGDEQAETTALPAGQQAAQAAGVAAADSAIEARARQALGAIMPDSDTLRLADLRAGGSGAACGRAEIKGPDGKPAWRPFVVTPEGVAVVSTTPEVRITDPEDPFPDFYIRWCASPAELARLQPNMVGGETLGLGADPPTPEIPDVPPDLPMDIAPVPAEPPPTERPTERPAVQAKAEPVRPPAPTGEDSFFNVIARPGEKEGR